MPLVLSSTEAELDRLVEVTDLDLDVAIDQARQDSQLAAALMNAETAPDKVDQAEEDART